MPPSKMGAPPAYKSLPDTASDQTLGIIPPNADQSLPFHLKTEPLTAQGLVPAYRSFPDTASASTLSPSNPRADQLVPSHLPIHPCRLESPPAYKPLPDTANARTENGNILGKSPPAVNPDPTADQLLPFHLPMPFA